MNLHHVELFYYVARHGGISRAVRHMPYGIQQPAMSSQILQLEQDLGAKLFDRQPFRLTAEGQELYDFARTFFDKADDVATRIRSKHSPKLRVAASEITLREYLPFVIHNFKKEHPKVRFSLRSGYQTEMEQWLQDGLVDVVIANLESKPQAGTKYIPIVKLPLVLLVPKTSPYKSAKDLWKIDRIDETLICIPESESVSQIFRQNLRQLRVDWPTGLEASSLELVTRYVANGYGIGVSVNVPTITANPKVRVLELDGFRPVEIAALWRPPATPLLESFLAAIRTRARELWPEVAV